MLDRVLQALERRHARRVHPSTARHGRPARRPSPAAVRGARLTVALSLGVLLPAQAMAQAPGATEQRTYPGGYRVLQYTPSALDRSEPAPLFVMLHGCNTTAEQQQFANELDAQAERDGFVVLYPEHDHLTALHAAGCWNFPTDTARSSPDPAGIATMVRDALDRRQPAIDANRVYLSGMSSGAMMAAVLGATYPDLFAAIHMNAGCAYRAGFCVGVPPTRASADLAKEAVTAMGGRRRAMPVLITQGDQDRVVPFAHSAQVRDQWRGTDNLIMSGSLQAPIAATPSRVREDTPDGRYPSTVEQFDDDTGCTLIERWTIHGMDHYWPGGSTDPAARQFTDPKGPDGGELAWDFFRRYRKPAAAGSPCATSPAVMTPPRRRCWSRRRFVVTLPRGIRHARVTLDGVRLRVGRRSVVIDLRGRTRGPVRVVITGRSARGRLVRIVRIYRPCTTRPA